MAYRIFQNDALQKYRQQFDLAQKYTYLTAAAYDYETNLSGNDPATGEQVPAPDRRRADAGRDPLDDGAWTIEPIVGSHGLADALGKMRDNFVVLKGQMGFNNPQARRTASRCGSELFRLRDTSDAKWRQTLQRYYTPDIYANPAVAKLAKKPYGTSGPQPGLVIPFGTTIQEGLNFFGLPLGPGDSAYNATQFATKIASVGVWFEGYDTNAPGQTPHVYLLPAGKDVVRPRNTRGRAALLERDRATPAGAVSDRRGGHAEPGLDPGHRRPERPDVRRSSPTPASGPIPYTEDLEPTS